MLSRAKACEHLVFDALVRLVLQQQRHDRCMAAVTGEMQWRLAVAINRIQLRAARVVEAIAPYQ